MMESVPGFNVDYREAVKAMAEDVQQGCGLVYELYVSRFSQAVEFYLAQVPEEDRQVVMALAEAEGYVPTEWIPDPKAERLCRHFMEPDTCPLGCSEQ